jgi:hypothetical protein
MGVAAVPGDADPGWPDPSTGAAIVNLNVPRSIPLSSGVIVVQRTL